MILSDTFIYSDDKSLEFGPIFEDDLDIWFKWFNNPVVVNHSVHSRSCGTNTIELQRSFLKKLELDEGKIQFSIRDVSENKKMIGVTSITTVSDYSGVFSIEILIGDVSCWNKGVAKKTIKTMCEYCENVLGSKKIVAGASSKNIASILAFERNGFLREGLLKSHEIIGGERVDIVILAKLNGVSYE